MDNKPKGRKPSLTMYEIARLSGVSQSTVSRVLNGNAPVAPEKQAAVMAVVQRLGYRPNVTAQGLAQGKSLGIGILTRFFGSPFYGEVLRGIGAGLEGSAYYPVISMGGNQGNEDYVALDMLLSRRVDALIILYSIRLTDDYVREIANHTPVIIVGRCVAGLEQHCVCVDSQAGAYTATSYLINKGHTRIAHIAGSLDDGMARRGGYLQALSDHGIVLDPSLIVAGDFMETSGYQAVEKLLAARLAHPFSAIFAGNDQMALGARLALYQNQVDVPGEISLIGFDDVADVQYMTPPLTTIRQPLYEMGSIAARAALAKLAGEDFALPEFPLTLVERQSVAVPGELHPDRHRQN